MGKLLEEVIERVKRLPPDEQERLAQLLLFEMGQDAGDTLLSDEQWAEIRRRMEKPAKFASDAEVEDFFRKYSE